MYTSRKDKIKECLPNIPSFRFDQINRALFDTNISTWQQVTTLSKSEREIMSDAVSLISVTLEEIFSSKQKDTYKAVLKAEDGKLFETVIMKNNKDCWTLCVSSQVGCAMRCTFCATGMMGLKRSLHADEITDQYRFWQQFLLSKPDEPQRISNVVFMGMGEPFANYENVKQAISTWLKYTDLGPTKIMVSTVGILQQLERVLVDPEWPHVQIALSLHSANQSKREEIVPTTTKDFIQKIIDWSHRYQTKLGNRNHKLTFEYTLISNENDTPELAKELAQYVRKTAFDKVNVIPYNPVYSKSFVRSDRIRIDRFKQVLKDNGVNVTERKTMGDDIDAACGQLALSKAE